MLGEGIADLPRVIANLRSIGYRGPISLELFNRDLWEQDPADGRPHGARTDSPACGRLNVLHLCLVDRTDG